MVITRRAQKALSVIALVLIVALLVAQIVGAVGRGASTQPNLVNTGAVTIPQSCDLFRNGFYGSSLRLLSGQWQQTHPTEAVC